MYTKSDTVKCENYVAYKVNVSKLPFRSILCLRRNYIEINVIRYECYFND